MCFAVTDNNNGIVSGILCDPNLWNETCLGANGGFLKGIQAPDKRYYLVSVMDTESGHTQFGYTDLKECIIINEFNWRELNKMPLMKLYITQKLALGIFSSHLSGGNF